MFNNILIVCVGNICRSPMAEYLLQQKIKKHGMDTCVSSAGLGALVGQRADEYAIEVMTEHGVHGAAHSSSSLIMKWLSRTSNYGNGALAEKGNRKSFSLCPRTCSPVGKVE